MEIYEHLKNSQELPLFKKFSVIDGREQLVNYVLLVNVKEGSEEEVLEFKFDQFERVNSKKPFKFRES